MIDELKPYNKNAITVCFSSDNNYAPYLGVTIKSLIDNSNEKYNYEIYIIDENISNENKNKILSLKKDNIYIFFIDISLYLENIDRNIFFVNRYMSISTYYRFFIPRIFKNFNKILYLDCDIIILEDVSILFFIESDKIISAVQDIEMVRKMFLEKDQPDFWTKYFKETLKIKNPYNSFQAGVLLLNIKKLIEFDFEKRCIETLIEVKEPIFVDQCILNSLCQDNINFIDHSWNVEWFLPIYYNNLEDLLPSDIYKIYIDSYNSAKILHYAGHEKPWTNPYYAKSYLWWEYARKTPFYEEIIYKNINNNLVINDQPDIKNNHRLSIADIIFSFINENNYIELMFLGIKIKIVKRDLIEDNYNNFIDRIFSIYKNNFYTRITILGIKIVLKS